jgi:2,4-dienoyl-CoA reductase-like NADH-dependent reductase (Old Yellow Enzyme family)
MSGPNTSGVREDKWTGSIAARSRKFVEVIKG